MTDNRMAWIRDAEKLSEADPEQRSSYTFEIATEPNIHGKMLYEGISCVQIGRSFLSPNLNSFLLTLESTHEPLIYVPGRAKRNGYYFPGGVVSELCSLFALFFQCRFFHLSSGGQVGDRHSVSFREIHRDRYSEVNLSLFADHMVREKRTSRHWVNGKNGIKLEDFMEKVKRLNPEYHLGFITACFNYNQAIRHYGVDHELGYIRLVTAIEALINATDYLKKIPEQDPLHKELDEAEETIKSSKLSEDAKKEVMKALEFRKSTEKFIRFVLEYSKYFFRGKKYSKKEFVRIKKSDLPNWLRKIYSARSEYLHVGKPMYMGTLSPGKFKWDVCSSMGMECDQRSIPEKEKIPYFSFFEKLTRHCILRFLDENLSL